MSADRIFVGLETSYVNDLVTTLDQIQEERLCAIATPIFHPRYQRDSLGISDKRDGPITRSDMILDSRTWSTSVVGIISPWIRLDSGHEQTRKNSEKAFTQEVNWASHLSLPALITPTPSINFANYAACINRAVLSTQYQQFWVRIPMYYPSTSTELDDADIVSERSVNSSTERPIISMDETRKEDPFETWLMLHKMTEFHSRIGVALEMTADLPSQSVIDRWIGERIKAIIIPTSIFLTNRKGYPTLSQRHQSVLSQFFKFKIQFFIKGKSRHQSGYLCYVQYLEHLFSKRPELSTQERFEAPYLDYLQAPLQPLMDNLESQTYETFERDPIKYSQYELAIQRALEDTDASKVSVVMVVGAGRGPLVRACLRAAVSAERTIRMYAVEKNPNAIITLRNMKISERWNNVTIIDCDMREWKASEKADIMVSELLGSFGDNELSPECLDGAQKFLKDDGISIPCKYISYISPISTAKLWNEVKSYDSLKSFETPYVVQFHNMYEMADSKPCFEFHHPNKSDIIDNQRYTRMIFKPKENAMIHGFAGYFEAQLYQDVMISINPATFSSGMFSWFPIYFPLREPVYVTTNQEIDIHFWRKDNKQKVWYEWCLGVQDQTMSVVHNPNGRSYWIGL